MGLKFDIDAEAIAKEFKELALEVEQDLQKGVANLAAITHAKVLEDSQQDLKSERKTFADNLGFEEISPGVWVVSVDEGALWIEEGIKPGTDMKPGLLKNAKTTKDGHKYAVIPFDHNKSPSQMTPYAQGVVQRIRENLKQQRVPFKGIELNKDGSPKRGLIHEFDFGGEKPGKGNTPVMNGVSVYQSVTKTGDVRRDILTFRTVTDGPGGQGKWIHPGYEAKKYLDKALDWAMQEWETHILPEILKKYQE